MPKTYATSSSITTSGGTTLTPTTVQTTNYSASASDFVPCDTATTGSLTVTLPTTPADGTQIGVAMIAQSGTRKVTIAAGGSDLFDIATTGATTKTLALLYQSTVLQYKSSNGVWYDIDNLPLAALDLRYPVLDVTGKILLAELPTALSTLRFGAILTDGHSYTQLGGTTAVGNSVVDQFMAFPRRISSVLNMVEIGNWGRSGAQILSLAADATTDEPGMGMFMRFYYPNEWFTSASTGVLPNRPVVKNRGALHVYCYGYNEPLRNTSAVHTANWENAIRRHFETKIQRARAAMVRASTSSTITYSGFGTTVLSGNSSFGYYTPTVGISWKKSAATNDFFSITLPDELPLDVNGNCHMYFTLIGSTNTQSFLKTSIVSNATTTVDFRGSGFGSDVGYKVLSAGDQVLIGTEQITLGATADGGVTWTGCTRGANGTTIANHTSGDNVTMPITNTYVDWSGSTSAASATANSFMGGIGFGADGSSSPVTVVKSPGLRTIRFTLTGADAGKTIKGIVKGISGNEFVGVDSWGIEDPDPNLVLLVNQPNTRATTAFGLNLDSFTVASLNSAMTNAASTFDSNVLVVDVATEIQNRFMATVQTTISSSATTTLKITPISTTLNELAVGSRIRVPMSAGPANAETMGVTVIDKTNGGLNNGIWSLTVTRNIDGVGAATSILSGNGVNNQSWMGEDFIHPSDYGHNIYASVILTALTGVSRTTAQAVNSGTYRDKFRRMGSGYYLLVNGTTRATATLAAGTEVNIPFEVTEDCAVVAIGIEVTTGAASSILIGGIRFDDGGLPGQVYQTLTTNGDCSTTGATEATGFIPLRPGVYFATFGTRTATPTIREYTATTAIIPPEVKLPNWSAPTGATAVVPWGYKSALTISSPLDFNWGGVKADLATVANAPVAWVRFSVPNRD